MSVRSPSLLQTLTQRWEKQPALAWTLATLWLATICTLAFLWHLGSIGLVDETEPLFAEAARQMPLTGDWITPYFNERTRFDKPPLVYWLMATAYQIIGVNEWAARLPSALAAIALVVFGFITLRFFGFPRPADAWSHQDLIRDRQGERTVSTRGASATVTTQLWLSAFIGSGLMALNPQTIVWARTGVSDMLLSGCMGTALMAFFWGYVQPSGSAAKPRWYLAFYILCGLAVLAKGPVGIVIPGLVVLAFLFYLGKFSEVWREAFPIRGMLLMAAITLPWYILVYLANGEAYIDSFFGYHNFERFTNVVNNHSAPWYFYFIVVLLGFAPYSVYLPLAIARLHFWRPANWRQQPRTAHLGLFALVWFAVIFGFFTIAVTKLPSYVLPLLPPAAILVGLLWSDQMTRAPLQGTTKQPRPTRAFVVSSLINLVFFAILAAAMAYSPNWMRGDPSMPTLPQLMQQSGVLVWGIGIWAGATLLGLVLLVRRQGRWLWTVNLLAFAAFLIFSVMPAIQIMDALRQLPLRQLSAEIAQQQKPQEPIVMVGFSKPSVVFYSQRPVQFFLHPKEAKQTVLVQPTPTGTALVLGRSPKIAELELSPDQYQVLSSAGEYELVRVSIQ